jgi:hypothetical protein
MMLFPDTTSNIKTCYVNFRYGTSHRFNYLTALSRLTIINTPGILSTSKLKKTTNLYHYILGCFFFIFHLLPMLNFEIAIS